MCIYKLFTIYCTDFSYSIVMTVHCHSLLVYTLFCHSYYFYSQHLLVCLLVRLVKKVTANRKPMKTQSVKFATLQGPANRMRAGVSRHLRPLHPPSTSQKYFCLVPNVNFYVSKQSINFSYFVCFY